MGFVGGFRGIRFSLWNWKVRLASRACVGPGLCPRRTQSLLTAGRKLAKNDPRQELGVDVARKLRISKLIDLRLRHNCRGWAPWGGQAWKKLADFGSWDVIDQCCINRPLGERLKEEQKHNWVCSYLCIHPWEKYFYLDTTSYLAVFTISQNQRLFELVSAFPPHVRKLTVGNLILPTGEYIHIPPQI